MNGASKNYRFGQKNHWRRTVWNEVLSRTDGREQHECILYLAGPQDLDRGIAVEKGVPTQNLIAVDRDADNVDGVRDQKCPVVHGDIQDVIGSWPIDRPVCAVLLDFCSGFTQPSVDVYNLLERKPFRRAVVMINLQRGRDAYCNAIRRSLCADGAETFDWLGAVSTWAYGPSGPSGSECLSDKHRGLLWLVYHAFDVAAMSEAMLIDQIKATPGYQDGFEDVVTLNAAGKYFKFADPHFYSYKSGVLTFDSVVLTNPSRVIDAIAEAEGRDADSEIEQRHESERSLDMARRISAMLAVRTMRRQAS